MNPIFLANMQAIIKPTYQPPPVELKTRFNKDSTASKIIQFLHKNGKSSGIEIMTALKLKVSPQTFIQHHILAGRVICERVSANRANYIINPQLNEAFCALLAE